MDESIIRRCEDMCNAKYEFTFNLRSAINNVFLLISLLLIIKSISMKKKEVTGPVKRGMYYKRILLGIFFLGLFLRLENDLLLWIS